jgi:hypothetical protein
MDAGRTEKSGIASLLPCFHYLEVCKREYIFISVRKTSCSDSNTLSNKLTLDIYQ